jgi:hypothetical protein
LNQLVSSPVIAPMIVVATVPIVEDRSDRK